MITSRAFSLSTLVPSLFAAAIFASLAGCNQEIISHNPKARASGIAEYEAGNYADAAGDFRSALRSDPRDYKSQYYLALSYEQMKQYQQAIQAFKASMDAQQRTLAGKDDEAQRMLTIQSLAACIAKSDTRDAETNALEEAAKSDNKSADWVLLAEVYKARGDVDSALDAYNRGVLIDPSDFTAAKQYGLYLEQIGQKQKAIYSLRKAYTLNQKDEQVNEALSRMNVVPGPGLKEQSQLKGPPIPEGPLPEVDLSTFKIVQQPDYSGTAAPAPSATPTAPPAPQAIPQATPQATPTYTPPAATPTAPPTAAPAHRKAPPVPGGRAVSGPQD